VLSAAEREEGSDVRGECVAAAATAVVVSAASAIIAVKLESLFFIAAFLS
jgi:hypothetical protein